MSLIPSKVIAFVKKFVHKKVGETKEMGEGYSIRRCRRRRCVLSPVFLSVLV